MASRKLLLRAARLLAAEAKVTRDSCAGVGKDNLWTCGGPHCQRDGRGKCDAQRRHDKIVLTVKQLREAA